MKILVGPRRFACAALHLTVAVLVAGCESGPTPVDPDDTGISIVAGHPVTDTINAVVASLEVEVRGEDGDRLSGQTVLFEAGLDSAQRELTVLVGSTATAGYSASALGTTDARGRASVRVRLGHRAGSGAVVISVPELGYTARAQYTIAPGAPARVVALLKDTAIYAGSSYRLRATVVDSWGNPRPDPVTYTAGAGPLSLAGGQVTGSAVGRGYVLARAEAWVDTAWVSVVPRGRIAAFRGRVAGPDTARLEIFELDGSDYLRFDVPSLSGGHPEWDPSGTAVLLEERVSSAEDGHIFALSPSGVRRRLVPETLRLLGEGAPQTGQDGWIYFAADPGAGQGHTEIWRIRADGTGAQRIGPSATMYRGDFNPSPSPGGGRVAYGTNRDDCCDYATLRVLNLQTGQTLQLGERVAYGSRDLYICWSPVDEDRFAYGLAAPNTTSIFEKQLYEVHANGSGRRRITPAGRTYRPEFDWSPDGRWLIARNFNSGELELIEVATGQILPLAFSRGLGHPAWRP
ncbi:MAG TPA: hypothetical protein VGB92_08660 [Longimicrobium sp.]|jgi:hypothetical protein